MEPVHNSPKQVFSSYQRFLILILALLQFTNILDFMIIAPLGAQLLRLLDITPAQFGFVVSAYAFSAGISGFIAAAFADRFDRKKMLLFFYGGFILGTFFCGFAPDYHTLLVARIITGGFGGVMMSVVLTIIGDVFDMNVRGRVMGFVMMAFSASQVIGIPLGLFLANTYNWHLPFLVIGALGLLVFIVIAVWMAPVDGHLTTGQQHKALGQLVKIISVPAYLQAFATMAFLAISGFLLIPYMSTFLVGNVGIAVEQLPVLYLAAGICTIVTGPLVGRLSDTLGKYRVFVVGTAVAILMILVYTHLSHTALAVTVMVNVVLMVGISSRMISAMALLTAVPEQRDRGGFMSINSSVQQIASGLASVVGGLITYETAGGKLANFDILGYISVAVMLISIVMLAIVNRHVFRLDVSRWAALWSGQPRS